MRDHSRLVFTTLCLIVASSMSGAQCANYTSGSAGGQSTTVTFEAESSGSTQFVDSGISFLGVIGTCNVNLYCPAFPPASGQNVLAGISGGAGNGVFGVSAQLLDTTHPVCEVSAYATGLSSTHMVAVDSSGNLVGTVETGDRNELEPGVTLAPNFLLKVISKDKPIARVVFQAPNSDDFEIDNFSFAGLGASSPTNPPGGNPPGGGNPPVQPTQIIVPILAQDDPQWTSVGYDDTDLTIGQDGCFLTGVTMLLDFFAHQENNNLSVTPPSLNNYLDAQPSGYFETYNGLMVEGGQVNPEEVAKYAVNNGLNLGWSFIPSSQADVNSFLSAGIPVMLNVAGGADETPDHWVIATGTTTVNGQQTYNIVDPSLSYGSPTTTLLDRYGNNFYNDPFVMAPPGPYGSGYVPPISGGVINVGAYSPIELRMTDPQGRVTGKLPDGVTTISNIPYSAYHPFTLRDDTAPLHSVSRDLPIVKYLHVQSPSIGQYQMTAQGTGSGPYTLVFTFYDSHGNRTEKKFTGTAIQGSRSNFTFSYDPAIITPIITSGCAADVDGNGRVDQMDLAAISTRLGASSQGKNYLEAADLNHDGFINVLDLAFAGRSLGCKATTF